MYYICNRTHYWNITCYKTYIIETHSIINYFPFVSPLYYNLDILSLFKNLSEKGVYIIYEFHFRVTKRAYKIICYKKGTLVWEHQTMPSGCFFSPSIFLKWHSVNFFCICFILLNIIFMRLIHIVLNIGSFSYSHSCTILHCKNKL